MTDWRIKGLVLVMIAGQMMAGAMTGRTIYLAHCGDHHEDHHDHDAPPCGDDDAHACLASFDHDHEEHVGHDHRCRCPHVHVKSDMRIVQRQRIGEVPRARVATPPLASFDPLSRTNLHDAQSRTDGPLALGRSSLSQTLAIRASRLLI